MQTFLIGGSMLLVMYLFVELIDSEQPWTAFAVIVCWTMALLA
jgi:hypothetical protein